MNTHLTADQSASFLTRKLRNQEPFSFWRFGDGFLECVSGKKGHTCDREPYSPELARDLLACWQHLIVGGPNVYLGDWQSASFNERDQHSRYSDHHQRLLGAARPNWLHFEALLLMRQSTELADFYRAVRDDPRPKLYLGPEANSTAAQMLGCEVLSTPMQNLPRYLPWIEQKLSEMRWEILLFGAGMAGNIPVFRLWRKFPERTYISLGSALDPLGRGMSRKQQLSPARARQFWRQTVEVEDVPVCPYCGARKPQHAAIPVAV